MMICFYLISSITARSKGFQKVEVDAVGNLVAVLRSCRVWLASLQQAQLQLIRPCEAHIRPVQKAVNPSEFA